MGSFWFGAVFALIEDQLTIARSEGAQFQATIGAREKRIILGDDDVGTVGQSGSSKKPVFEPGEPRFDLDVSCHDPADGWTGGYVFPVQVQLHEGEDQGLLHRT